VARWEVGTLKAPEPFVSPPESQEEGGAFGEVTPPRISVIVPCFNAEPYLRDTLRSAQLQEYTSLEIIVVDDGSTDRSAEIVEREFPGIRLVRTPQRGPGAARNLGTKLSRGQFVQYLDADDLLCPGKLRRQVEALEGSGADVAYGDWQRLEPRVTGGCAPGAIVKRRLTRPEIDLFTDFWCPPAAYLFRRDTVERIGGWNERLKIIQDARFALDCALHGATFVLCRGMLAQYRVHSSGSVSTRDPLALVRERFDNAAEVESWWRAHGGLVGDRAEALIRVYGGVARAAFGLDPVTFEESLSALNRLSPGYVPAAPWRLLVASRVLGYRRAEAVARQYRHARHAFRRLPGLAGGQ